MKIKHKLYISAVVSLCLITILGVLVFQQYYEEGKQLERAELTDKLHRLTAELAVISSEYVTHHEKRMEQQWQAKLKSILLSINSVEETDIPLLDKIQNNLDSLNNSFSQLQSNYKNRKELRESNAPLSEIERTFTLEKRLAALMRINSLNILTNSSRIEEESRAEVRVKRKRLILLLIVSVFFLIAVIGISAVVIASSISKPIEKLVEGVERVGKGDLDYSVEITSMDETGFLTQVFNEMVKKRKKIEEELRFSEEKFSKAFRSSPILMSIATLREGRFVDANDTFLTASGYSREEVIGSNSTDLGIWADTADSNEVRSQLEEKGIVSNREIGFRTKNGDILTLLFSAEIIEMEGAPSVIAVAQNITARKKLASQLLHAQKLEALGQFAGGMAHDFNNILSAIMNCAYLMKIKSRKNEQVGEDIDRIRAISEKAAQITKGLLAFCRKQRIELLPVKINDVVRDVQKVLSKFIGEDIILKIKVTDKEPLIMADKSQMEQLLMNLATNARDAMPNGGNLTIETELQEIDDIFAKTHGFGEHGVHVLLTVSDTGKGMNEKTKQRIFEPFFTTKEVGKGTGLGLSISYGIVKDHNGHINVYSEYGKGSSFKIYFPMIESKNAVEEKDESISVSLGKGETILVAEDESTVMYAIKSILKEFGYKVIEAVNGEDALKKFVEFKENIDLLILDVIMPGMNGKEVYDEIVKLRPGVKAIFTSGYTADIISSKKIFEKNMTFLSKPVQPDKLLLKIREVLENDYLA